MAVAVGKVDSGTRTLESGKWTAEVRSRLTDPVGALAGMGTVLISIRVQATCQSAVNIKRRVLGQRRLNI
jgi:hypothetical protein